MDRSHRRVFEHRSVIAAPAERVWAFHQSPDALYRLTMPPMRIQIVRDDRRSLTGGELEFLLRLGPLPVRWVAAHEPGPEPMSFVDRQVVGPLAFWEHEHIMRPCESGTELLDRITLSYRPGLRYAWTRLTFSRTALRILFAYRHWRTRRAVR